jgi:hypothetical protein
MSVSPAVTYNKLSMLQVGMIAATAAGAASVFPEMPAVIADLFDESMNPHAQLVKYMALYILILQGGSGFQHDLALVGTVGFFVVSQALNTLFPDGLGGDIMTAPVAMEPPEAVMDSAPPPNNNEYYNVKRRF